MRYFSILFFVIFQVNCFAQQSDATMAEVTEKIQLRLMQEVENEIPAFKKQMENEKEDTATIAFKADTFRVERFEAKWLKLNYSDYSMKQATVTAAKMYDALLNKYFRKLLKILTATDKKKLVDAQKAWLAYRDSEENLAMAVDNEAYSGGSIEALSDDASYLDLIKQRVIMLFNYYDLIKQR